MNILRMLGLTDNNGLTIFGIISVMLSGIIGFMAMIFLLLYWVETAACRQYSQATGLATQYLLPSGCFIEFHGRFIPYQEYLARAVTNE